MFTSQYRILPLIIKVFVALCGIGTLTISVIMFKSFLNSPNNTSFMGIIMFLLISFIYFYVGARSIRRYTFGQDSMKISVCFGIVKFKYDLKDIKGYSIIPYKTKSGIYPGIAIAIDNTTYHFSNYELKNYFIIEDFLKQKLHHVPEIKLIFWTTILKFFTFTFATFFLWVMASIIL